MGLRRRPRGFDRRRTVLIVGEGRRTEPIYFTGLKQEPAVRKRFKVNVYEGPGLSPEAVVQEAISRKKQASQRRELFDEVWCVLDVESADRRRLLNAAARLAAENGIGLCLSNPALEVWFLAHFRRTCQPFMNGAAVIQELNPHWQARCKRDYDKGDKGLYGLVAGLTDAALQNARQVRESDHPGIRNTADANSSTEVYRLVGRLLGK